MDFDPPYGGLNPPAPASQSGALRFCLRHGQKCPPMAVFCELVVGLQTPNLVTSGAKWPIVSGGYLKYSRFWENPFNPNPEPAQIVNRRATRSTPVCSNCQSDDIISHAVAQWSNESQEWQLASTFDQPTHCNGCKGPCGIVWLALN